LLTPLPTRAPLPAPRTMAATASMGTRADATRGAVEPGRRRRHPGSNAVSVTRSVGSGMQTRHGARGLDVAHLVRGNLWATVRGEASAAVRRRDAPAPPRDGRVRRHGGARLRVLDRQPRPPLRVAIRAARNSGSAGSPASSAARLSSVTKRRRCSSLIARSPVLGHHVLVAAELVRIRRRPAHHLAPPRRHVRPVLGAHPPAEDRGEQRVALPRRRRRPRASARNAASPPAHS
jgi:hypothetical protein